MRFFRLDYQSAWADELHSLLEANPNRPLSSVFASVSLVENTPPLYFYLLYFIFKIFGYNTFVLRFFSAIVGVAGIYAIYLLGKELIDKYTGLIAAFILCLNGYHLYYSQEGRPYAFFLLFTILAFYALIKFIKAPTRKNVLIYTVFSTLMIYGHFFGLFALVAQYAIIFIFILISEKEKRKALFINSLLSGLITVVLFLPALKILLIATKITSSWIPPPVTYPYTKIITEFFGYSEFLLTFAGIGSVLYLISLSKEKDCPVKGTYIIENKTVFASVILFPWIAVVMLIPLVKSELSAPVIAARYFINIIPAIVLLVAIGISQFTNTIIKGGLLLLFFVFSLTNIVVVRKYYTIEHKTQFREVSHYILEHNKDNEPLVSTVGWYFSYYLDKDKVPHTIINQPLDTFVNELMRDSSKIKSFWYADGHHFRYTPSPPVRKFIEENFIVADSTERYDAWTKHFVKKSR